jgi:hypothetical protein
LSKKSLFIIIALKKIYGDGTPSSKYSLGKIVDLDIKEPLGEIQEALI